MARNLFQGNRASSASSFGGALWSSSTTALFVNNWFVNNAAQAGGSTAHGGAVSLDGGSPVFLNNTFFSNSAQDSGLASGKRAKRSAEPSAASDRLNKC